MNEKELRTEIKLEKERFAKYHALHQSLLAQLKAKLKHVRRNNNEKQI